MLNKLIQAFSILPGLGPKSAKRIVLQMMSSRNGTIDFGKLIIKTAEQIVECKLCNNIDEINPCKICNSPSRDSKKICIIEKIEDLWNIEESNHYNGLYYVVKKKPSSQHRITQEINLDPLLERIKTENVVEIILANNPTTSGQTNAFFIIDTLQKEIAKLQKKISITELGRGVPIGSEIDYLDENTIGAAFKARKDVI